MPDITVRLSGGLGNQLFQYAAGRAAAIASGASLLLDSASFESDPLHRRFSLGRFPLRAELRDLVGWHRTLLRSPGIWRIARSTGFSVRVGDTRFLFDRLRGFDARVTEISEHRVLTGYWQDERYFAHAFDSLRAELDPSAAFPEATRALGAELATGASLALHVRRADFAQGSSPHGTCSPAYYAAAVAWIRSAADVDRAVVFSDDPTWAQRTLDIGMPFQTMPRDAARGDDEDLWLMSRCRHLVIANSSFSWWAAWLAEHRSDSPKESRALGEHRANATATLIACPSRWYRASAGPIPHPAPERWRRIEDPAVDHFDSA